ncbi:proteasome activator complex subunit 4B isoform X2 [Amyelois transitella]|uniref:proteasome activator complex subunit 4B isoform X2 n=1 Tax=Amyelois transitella TaxID=680683 RepID=UPI002990576E|nr:proteasome activator complex subunit 4B isoform X2 [Amyelois transitella]
MFEDDDYENMVTSSERIKSLGFKPQKEILTNRLLPYAEELDEESLRFLEQVKTNLAKSVMLREMKPACGVWSSRLMKYIRIYGLKFSKEDHITLVKLTFELALTPDLEPCKIHKFATIFTMLTKKLHLISPEELTLPWRPLYELGKKIYDKSSGLFHYLTPDQPDNDASTLLAGLSNLLPGIDVAHFLNSQGVELNMPKSLESSYLSMVKCARPYFELSATQEILDEFLPQVCPWNTESHVLGQLVVFLPVSLNPNNAAQGHLLWFEKMMTLWDSCHNSPCGVSELIMLFAGLAKHNPGSVDWAPFVPNMFTRFLHALYLPVSYKDMQISKCHSLDMKQVALWIVWAINPDGVVLKHLRSFLAGVESYLHSANSGRWSYKLRDLLRKLAREFLNRVRREREKKFKQTWENQTPEAYKLREEDITEFVNIVFEPTLQAVYSRSGSLDIFMALQNLATLRPAIVVPPLLEKLRTSLTSLTEPHRVTAVMSAVASVARPMLRGRDSDYPEGQTHVVPFLMAVLPGLDPNDTKKTLVTLHFILIFSWMVPIIDCSSAHEHWSDLTEEELLTCESTAQLEDFVLVFLDRLFVFIESSVMEHVRLDTKESELSRSKIDGVMETSMSSAATAVLMQCSPKIFKEALRKFKAFATESTFEINVSGSMVGVLLRVFARVDSEATLAAFVPKLCQELTELLATDETLHEENPSRDLVYRLVLLMHAVECDGVVLLKYIPQILPVLDRALKLHSVVALGRACEILSHIFTSLSNLYIYEWKSSPKNYSEAPEKWLPIREWGDGCLLKEANFKWHMPNALEAECAQMLVDRYLKPEILRLRQWLSDERPICRERRLRSFHIINAVLSCATFMPPPDEDHIAVMESQVPATSMPLTNGIKHVVTLDGVNVRVSLTKLMLEVQSRMLADKSDDTRGFEMLIQVWERVVVTKGLRASSRLDARFRSFGALERATDGRGGISISPAGTARLRMLLADAARLQDDARLDLVCDAGITRSALDALHALAELSVNTYSTVRVLSQVRLYWMLSHYPYSYRALVPKLAEILNKGGEGDEWHAKHKGVLYIMLGPRSWPFVAKQDWEVVRTLWPAILKAPLSEKPSILRLEQAFIDCLQRNFPAVNTRLTMAQSAIDIAQTLLPQSKLTEPSFAELLKKAPEKEKAYSDKLEATYRELIEELVDIAETPNIQWRRLELAMQMLTFCPSIQTDYTPRAVRLMLRGLIHDDIAVRKISTGLTYYALKQCKRPLKKIEVDPYEVAGVTKPIIHVPGYRKDLEWTLWSEERVPKTDEEWDKPWLRNLIYGFYAWPKKLEVAAPSSEQVRTCDVPLDKMTESEQYVHEFFSDDANIDKLVGFLTVEEKKGKDKFSGMRFSVFKLLFAQFGSEITEKLLSRALKCASDTQEAPQRFAAEVAAAALRASRKYPREQALALQQAAMDIVQAGLTTVTPETMDDWGTSLGMGLEKLDPLRGAIVIKSLLQLCVPPAKQDLDVTPDTHASFVICARLYALQGALVSMMWRGAPLATELLERLEAAHFTQHPYQNVREIVGALLMTIFMLELVFPGGEHGPSPNLSKYLDTVLPRLAALYDENGDIVVKPATSLPSGSCGARAAEASAPAPRRAAARALLLDVARLAPAAALADDDPQTTGGSEHKEDAMACGETLDAALVSRLDSALRLAGDAVSPLASDHANAVSLLTTVLRGCLGVVLRGPGNYTSTLYRLAPAACALAARGAQHDELPRAAAAFLAALALAHHPPAAFHTALRTLERLADDRSWWARLSCLEFAQPLLFYGLPMLCADPDRAVRAENFTLKLMRDPRLEVRQSAAKLLTGLMHCRALPDEEKTLKKLMRSCHSRELVERHCGVLGLCAYLASRPYSLGPRLGDVLTELARHTNAPDPIPATIRTALADFRRTHQDDWPKHREQLTEEELDLLADLTSPPSYCA